MDGSGTCRQEWRAEVNGVCTDRATDTMHHYEHAHPAGADRTDHPARALEPATALPTGSRSEPWARPGACARPLAVRGESAAG